MMMRYAANGANLDNNTPGKTGIPAFVPTQNVSDIVVTQGNGEIRITYVPDAACVELKSLKYYMIGFRNRGIFYEHVTNEILDDLVAALHPRRITVVGDFSVRGGMKTVVTATRRENRYRRRWPCLTIDQYST